MDATLKTFKTLHPRVEFTYIYWVFFFLGCVFAFYLFLVFYTRLFKKPFLGYHLGWRFQVCFWFLFLLLLSITLYQWFWLLLTYRLIPLLLAESESGEPFLYYLLGLDKFGDAESLLEKIVSTDEPKSVSFVEDSKEGTDKDQKVDVHTPLEREVSSFSEHASQKREEKSGLVYRAFQPLREVLSQAMVSEFEKTFDREPRGYQDAIKSTCSLVLEKGQSVEQLEEQLSMKDPNFEMVSENVVSIIKTKTNGEKELYIEVNPKALAKTGEHLGIHDDSGKALLSPIEYKLLDTLLDLSGLGETRYLQIEGSQANEFVEDLKKSLPDSPLSPGHEPWDIEQNRFEKYQAEKG